MYCPRCGVEYRVGISECSDCRVALVDEKPRDPRKPDLELVTVLESNDPLLIGLAKATLTDAGIPFYVLGEELGLRLGPVGSFIQPWRRIQVAADREQETREPLQQMSEFYEAGGTEDQQD